MTGYPHVSLWATATATDADLVFALDDVAPDGSSTQVMQGYLNAPHAADLHGAPVPLVPGQAAKYELDLYPTAYVFAAGHRMRLVVAGGASVAQGLQYPQGPGKNPAANTWSFRWTRRIRRRWNSRLSAPPGSNWSNKRGPGGAAPSRCRAESGV